MRDRTGPCLHAGLPPCRSALERILPNASRDVELRTHIGSASLRSARRCDASGRRLNIRCRPAEAEAGVRPDDRGHRRWYARAGESPNTRPTHRGCPAQRPYCVSRLPCSRSVVRATLRDLISERSRRPRSELRRRARTTSRSAVDAAFSAYVFKGAVGQWTPAHRDRVPIGRIVLKALRARQ